MFNFVPQFFRVVFNKTRQDTRFLCITGDLCAVCPGFHTFFKTFWNDLVFV
jgi:hypothetical protein